jgi:hypothetical protein
MTDNVGYTPGVGVKVASRGVTYSGEAATLQVVGLATVSGPDDGKTVADIDNSNPLPVALAANQSVNITQVNGTAVSDTNPLYVETAGYDPASDAIKATNVVSKIRDAFETFDVTDRWAVDSAGDAIIALGGNALSASYLEISLDPLAVGGETVIRTRETIGMPFELTAGLSLSQRSDGQLLVMETASTDTDPGVIPLTPPTPLTISAIQQAASVLTVTTTAAHGLLPGMRVQIYGVSDSRFNYGPLVVATIPSTTQFTATAGPFGTIASVTAGPFASGNVLRIDALGSRRNGSAITFENTTVTNASFFGRSEGGSALPSGTAVGNHSITVGTTAPIALATAANTYAWSPTNSYSLLQQIEALTWFDALVDGSAALPTLRYKRGQVVPNPIRQYETRFRAQNLLSMTRPVAQIVSAVKTGTTTATITTDVPHGLTTADQILIYGVRDQAATAFPNLTVATAVASTPTTTTFTVVIGTAATVTSYGGFVARMQAGRAIPGVSPQVVQSVTRTSNVLTVVGNATWTGAAIGDLVNLVGVRDNATGASLGVDGAYRVRDLVTTTLTLEPIVNYLGTTVSPTGTNIGLTNCGGGLIRRTDLRVHFVRMIERERIFIESPFARNDQSLAAPVAVTNSVAVTATNLSTNLAQVAGTTTVTGGVAGMLAVGGNIAEDTAATSNPVIVGGVVRTALPASTNIAGDAIRATFSTSGQLVTKEFSPPDLDFVTNQTITTNTQTAIRAAQGATVRQNITQITYQNTNATATLVTIQEASNTLIVFNAPASMANPVQLQFPTPLRSGLNAALNYTAGTTGASVLLNVTGYNSN